MSREQEPQTPAQSPAGAEPPAPTVAPPLAALLRGASAADLTPQQVLALQRGAGNATVARLLRELAPPAVEPGATAAGLLVSDDVAAPPRGRVRLSDFLDRVEREVSAVAERELAAGMYATAGCPWIAHWIGYYRGRAPAEVEAAIRRYAPAVAQAGTVDAQVAAIGARVADGIRVWSHTGEVPQPPPDSPGAPPGWQAGLQAAPAASAARSPAAERARLGPGRALEAGVAARMGAVLGGDLSGVRVHADAAGAALAARHGARATTVGEHVAFAPGAYAPGTPVGDALLAHELAHTIQQAGAPAGELAAEHAAEADADTAAVGTMAALWGGTGELARRLARNARPTVRSGLALRSCPMPAAGGPAPPSEIWVRQRGWPVILSGGDLPPVEESTGKTTPHGTRFTFDSDGDQRKDMDALIRVDRRAKGRDSAHVELTQLSSKQTRAKDLEVPAMGTPLPAATLSLVTDGVHPTEFAITDMLAVRVDAGAPGADGGVMHSVDVGRTGEGGAGVVAPAMMGFAPETGAPNTVFSTAADPLDPRAKESRPTLTGGIWSLDVAIGLFADRFRLSFSPAQAGQVMFGLGVIADEGPVAGEGTPLRLNTTNLQLAILAQAGPALVLDLDGDGVADLTLHDRLSVPSKEQLQNEGITDPDLLSMPAARLFRDHHIYAEGPALAAAKTFFFPVRADSIRAGPAEGRPENRQAASDLRAVTGLAEQQAVGTQDGKQGQLAGELAHIDRTLIALRKQALDNKLISPELFHAWETLAADFVVLAAFRGAGGTPQVTAEFLQFKVKLTEHAQEFYKRLHDETPTKTERPASNYGTGKSENVYTGDLDKGPATHVHPGADFVANISLGRWDQAVAGYRTLEHGFDRWVAKVNRDAFPDPDQTRPETMRGPMGEHLVEQRAALEALQGRKELVRVAAVLHPTEPWEATGRAVELPLSLYYWREGDEWKIQDLSRPDDMPTWRLPIPAQHRQLTEPSDELFAKLKEGPHFPAGIIHYALPGGRGGTVETTGPSVLEKWGGLIAATLAAAGLALVTAGGSIAVLGGYILGAGALLGAGVAAEDLLERAQHDRLTAKAVILDVTQIVSAFTGLAAMQAGKILLGARAAAAEGQLLEATPVIEWANRWFLPLRQVNLGADLTAFAVMTDDLHDQVKAIRDSGADPGEQSRALTLLFTQFALTTGLTVMAVKGALPEFAAGTNLSIETVNGVRYAVPAGTSVPGAAINRSRLTLGSPGGSVEAHLNQIRTTIPGQAGESLARVEGMTLRPDAEGNVYARDDGVLLHDDQPAGRVDDLLGEVSRANNAAAAHGLDTEYAVRFEPEAHDIATRTPRSRVRVTAVGRGGPVDPARTASQVGASQSGRTAQVGTLAQRIHAADPTGELLVLPGGRLRVPGAPDLDGVALLDQLGGSVARAGELAHRLGGSLARLASDLTGPELEQLSRVNAAIVRWAGGELTGTETRALMNDMPRRLLLWLMARLPGARPAPSAVRALIAGLEPARVAAALGQPQITPEMLIALVDQQNLAVARSVIDTGMANAAQWGRVAQRLSNLWVATRAGGELIAPGAMASDAVATDNNVVSALRRLIAHQVVWVAPAGAVPAGLNPNERAAITKLRQLVGQLPQDAPHAGPGAPDTGTNLGVLAPTDAELHELMAHVASGNVIFMESAPGAPGRGTAYGLDVDRNSPEYNQALQALQAPPPLPWPNAQGGGEPVGGPGGIRDRSLIADALFARQAHPGAIPVFLTVDDASFVRLAGFAEQLPGGGFVDFRPPTAAEPHWTQSARLRAANPAGFVISVGGRRLRVVSGAQ